MLLAVSVYDYIIIRLKMDIELMRTFDNLYSKEHESEFRPTKKWRNENSKTNQKWNFQSYSLTG